MVGAVLYLVPFGVTAITTVAAFFGVGFFLLVHPKEEIPATEMRTPEATSISSVPATAPREATSIPRMLSPAELERMGLVAATAPHEAISIPPAPATAPREATLTPPAPATAPREATLTPPAPATAPREATLTPPGPTPALHKPTAAISTYDQYRRDARIRFLRKQQALFELKLTAPNLSATETARLTRQKAYFVRAIERTLALPQSKGSKRSMPDSATKATDK